MHMPTTPAFLELLPNQNQKSVVPQSMLLRLILAVVKTIHLEQTDQLLPTLGL